MDSAQRAAVEHMMAETSSGRWAARTTGRTESRQNGKGDEIEVVESYCLTQRGEAIVHTAHEIPTAKSAHARLVGLLEGHRDLRKLVKRVRYANGDQNIEMQNGGIIAYRTRTAGGGRGLDDISRLVVDEAQHAQPEQLASSTPILAANPNPQTNFIGSAGIADRSAWWWEMRRRALGGDAGSFAWLEHSAEKVWLDADGRVVSEKPDVWDRENWRRANPAHPARIEAAYLEEQLRTLGPALFAREHLGVWDPDPYDGAFGLFGPGVWEAVCSNDVPQPSTGLAFSIDVNPERTAAAISVAGPGSCGLLEYRPGVGWAVDEAIRVAKKHTAAVAVASNGPAGALIPDLERAGVRVEALPMAQMRDACGAFFDAVCERKVKVQRHAALDSAVASAVKKTSGDAWVWDRRADGDVSPLVAVTAAFYVAATRVADPMLMVG